MVWACVLVMVGVALMFGLSAFGGVGGTSGHSRWWLVILLPYPIGWVMGIVVLLLMLRRKNGAAEASH